MNVKSRLPLSLALLLAVVAGEGLAYAESPLPDPIAPAVVGRPLEQIRPARPRRPAAMTLKPQAARPATPARKVVRQQPPPAAAALQQSAVPKAAALGAGAAPALAAPKDDADGPARERQAKQALDDRADPRTRLDDVGKGTHFARKPLGAGAYFDDKDRAAVRKYYEAHPAATRVAGWQIGQPVPRGTAVASVPQDLRSSLPKLPPGHRYVQVGGELVLIASGSGMVVDGISRASR